MQTHFFSIPFFLKVGFKGVYNSRICFPDVAVSQTNSLANASGQLYEVRSKVF